MGMKSSETVFTDSTVPNSSCCACADPTSGSCTNTTSPRASCAKWVMPTRAVPSPRSFTHSWSLVYLSSAGYMGPPGSSVNDGALLALVEGRRDDLGLRGLAADLDEDAAAHLGVLGGDHGEADVLAQGGGRRAAGDEADGPSVLHHGHAVAGDVALLQGAEAHDLARQPRRFRLEERLAAQEVALVEFHDPAESGLQRVDLVADL